MTSTDSAHNMQMVISSQWGTFFADVAQKYQGRPVGVEIGEDLLLERPAGATAPLQGIAYDGHKGLVISTGGGAETKTYTAKAPNLVMRDLLSALFDLIIAQL